VFEGQITRETDLLTPAYYVAGGFTPEEIFAQLTGFAQSSPNWLVGDPDPAYQQFVARLRQRGVAGPLWSYFAMVQQIKPQELGTTGRFSASK